MIKLERRTTLVSGAMRDCRWVLPKDRTNVEHLFIVYMNYADAFENANDFLSQVASECKGYNIGSVARALLMNGVDLCRFR